MAETSFGRYRLIAELGHGGMADVFLAVQAGPTGSGFRKLTVIKRLRQNLADEPEFIAMLVDEARIAARLNHPNVVQTNEVGDWQGTYFIAMEYLDGQPLHRIQHRSAQRAKDGSPPIFAKELQYIVLVDALAGLHHAHELLDYDGTALDIVHRDMTPHNIFVTYEGQVKVVDFGIAKAAGRASETRQGIIKGKVRYMAPEQAIGQRVDRHVDIFAVGVMLWEAATGKRMWKDMDDLQIVQALVAGEIPRSPRAVNPDVPEAIDAICQRALAQKPEDRYPTAEAFRNDLEQYLIDAGIMSRARRQISAALDTLFKDKRTEIRSLIEKQLADVELRPSGEFAPITLAASTPSLPSMASSASGSQSIMTGHVSGTSTRESEILSTDSPPARPRPMLAAFGAAILVALVVVFGVVTVMRRDPRSGTDQSGRITVRVNATPATAKVILDDGPPEVVPLVKTVPRDGKHHKIRLEAEGYESKSDIILFAQDLQLSFDLLKHGEPTPPPTTSIAAATVTTKHPPPNAPVWKPTPPPPGTGKHHATPPPPETAAPPPTNTAPPPPTTANVIVTPPSPTQPPSQPTAAPTDVAKEHRKAVNATVRAHAGEVQACYDRAKMQSPQLAGSVSIAATLTPSGAAPNARVSNSTVRASVGSGPTMLESCLVERFRAWTFTPAPPGAPNEIAYTFRFE